MNQLKGKSNNEFRFLCESINRFCTTLENIFQIKLSLFSNKSFIDKTYEVTYLGVQAVLTPSFGDKWTSMKYEKSEKDLFPRAFISELWSVY